jgi:hypothetical protein
MLLAYCLLLVYLLIKIRIIKFFKFIFNSTFNNFRNITYIYSCKKFELSDLFGNLLGVSIVLTINFFYRKYENYKN